MNKLTKRKSLEGFTIIEVVLVLAIAGLIFLMVFIALPALQRNQRDTGRKNDASTVASAINTFRSNNRSSLPTANETVTPGSGTGVLGRYIDKLSEIDSVTYTKTIPTSTSATNDVIQVVGGAKCDSDTSNGKAVKGTSKSAAVFVKLENGNSVFYCQDV